jgi:alpha-ribazole phosphatase/probable phosphoglycerate mutase
MSTTTLDLLRHGDVADGTRLLGQSDLPLSALGWEQLRAMTNGKTPPWGFILSSPLQRCAAFAAELAGRHELPLYHDRRLMEMDFGDWSGQLFTELLEREGVRMQAFWDNPLALTAPGGEDYNSFERRVAEVWEEVLTTYQDRHGLIIAHGGTIRAILRQVLGFPVSKMFQIEVPYACLSRIEQFNGEPARLVFHNGLKKS